MTRLILLAFGAASIGIASCAPSQGNKAGQKNFSPIQPVSSEDVNLNGIWRSRPYGQLLKIESGNFEFYDLTDSVCVLTDTSDNALSDYFEQYRTDQKNTQVFFSDIEEPYEYPFERLESLPTHCTQKTANTAEGNFNAFVDYFAEQYPFFNLYEVDWDTRVKEARKSVSSDMTDEDLYALFKVLLRGLTDAHIELSVTLEGEREVFTVNPGRTEKGLFKRAVAAGENPLKVRHNYRRKYWFDDTKEALLGGQGVMTGDGAIQYGITSDDIGLISLMWMGGYTESEEDTEIGVLDQAMESALQLFENHKVKAVILDLSINYGGYDYLARAVAGRFTDIPVHAYSKISGNDPSAKPFSYDVVPSGGARYTGPVYVMTSDVTVSAAEILTIAMRALPNVTHAGETTRGAFSDVLSRQLPNGWELAISTEVYKDNEGMVWESLGVPPNEEIMIFERDDPFRGHLEAVEALIEKIDERHPQK